jgi:hypothetical protein
MERVRCGLGASRKRSSTVETGSGSPRLFTGRGRTVGAQHFQPIDKAGRLHIRQSVSVHRWVACFPYVAPCLAQPLTGMVGVHSDGGLVRIDIGGLFPRIGWHVRMAGQSRALAATGSASLATASLGHLRDTQTAGQGQAVPTDASHGRLPLSGSDGRFPANPLSTASRSVTLAPGRPSLGQPESPKIQGRDTRHTVRSRGTAD